jgi:quercetin dioxygenase-like cupin family protein
MNKLARELARLLTLAFFIAGVVATPAMAQDKKAEKERVQKVLIDNGKVRVTETTIKRGEVSPNIERPYRITRVLQGGETMRTHADGKTEKKVFKTGDVFEAGPDKPYSSKNVGKTDIVLYSVVPKQAK